MPSSLRGTLIGWSAPRPALVLVLLAAGFLWASARADDPPMPGTKPEPAEERPQPEARGPAGWLDSQPRAGGGDAHLRRARLDGLPGRSLEGVPRPAADLVRCPGRVRLGQRGVLRARLSLLADVRLPSLDKLLSRGLTCSSSAGAQEVEKQV